MQIHQRQDEPEKRTQKFSGFKFQAGDMELIDVLPPGQRNILLTEGPYRLRAAQLGIALGTVRSRLHRARAALEALREERAHHASPIPN